MSVSGSRFDKVFGWTYQIPYEKHPKGWIEVTVYSTEQLMEKLKARPRTAEEKEADELALQLEREQAFIKTLYEDGPQTTKTLAKGMGLSTTVIGTVASLLKAEGRITTIWAGKPKKRHWILSSDVQH